MSLSATEKLKVIELDEMPRRESLVKDRERWKSNKTLVKVRLVADLTQTDEEKPKIQEKSTGC